MQKASGIIDYLFFIFNVLDGDYDITTANINAIPNRAAPYNEPKGIKTVLSELLVPATIAVITSGAPFAKAKNVTPANA